MKPVIKTDLPFPLFKRGKVRDVYDLGDRLLLVATDRISAFDVVLEPGIPGKGILLTQLSNFWFEMLNQVIPNHLVATEVDSYPEQLRPHRDLLNGRSVWVRKTQTIPVECVARGYIIGSGWKDYQRSGAICGITLPQNLQLGDRLPEPIFTPATKADEGHDENISFDVMEEMLGGKLAKDLRALTLDLYHRASSHALERGIILADTKLEFGMLNGSPILIDEIFTSDSSRFWPAAQYRPGISPPSFDKQFVRDYLESCGWNKSGSPPPLPPVVVQKTLEKYREAYRLITDMPAPA